MRPFLAPKVVDLIH
jgi:hypothetical protein